MKRSTTRTATALGAVLALALGACSGGGSGAGAGGEEPRSGTSFVAGDGAVTLVPPQQRRDPVAFAATTLAGERLDVVTLRGTPVVLNTWASWCAPCRKEAPELAAAAKELAGRASFVGINVRDRESQALAFERTYPVGYPSVRDEDGQVQLALGGALPPSAIPTTLVLDAQGRVAARVSGAVTRRTLVGIVDDVATGAG